MNIALFAHAGENHQTAAEAAQHASGGVTLSTPVLFWLALILIPLILLIGMHLLKFKLTTKLLVLSTFLIIYSVVSYQHPGVYSVLALTTGFSIVFLLSIAGLSADG
jgi:hypothetical protein